MGKLINELRYEHRMIYQLLSSLRDLDGGPEDIRKLLLAARQRIMEHLRKEDTLLYPALSKAAGRDKILYEKLDKLEAEMAVTTARLDRFFNKYSKSGTLDNFIGDLNSIYSLVKDRLQKEELYLFTEYAACSNKE